MRRVVALALVVVTSQVVGSSTAATVIGIVPDHDLTWVQVEVDSPGGPMVVAIVHWKGGGRRMVWQRCRFREVVAGTYRCGFDSASVDMGKDGSWAAEVRIDGELTARQSFSI